jgi:transposase
LNIFVVISYNYKRIISYKITNLIGKITKKVYIEQVLPQLLPDLQEKGLVLVQDIDLVYRSKYIAE